MREIKRKLVFFCAEGFQAQFEYVRSTSAYCEVALRQSHSRASLALGFLFSVSVLALFQLLDGLVTALMSLTNLSTPPSPEPPKSPYDFDPDPTKWEQQHMAENGGSERAFYLGLFGSSS